MSSCRATNAKTPGTCGGVARIDGTRIPVRSVFAFTRLGCGNSHVRALAYPDLTDEQIDAARAYAAEHADEMAPDPEDDDDTTPGAKP